MGSPASKLSNAVPYELTDLVESKDSCGSIDTTRENGPRNGSDMMNVEPQSKYADAFDSYKEFEEQPPDEAFGYDHYDQDFEDDIEAARELELW